MVGSYEPLNNDELALEITVQLENKYRNLLLLSIPTSIALGYYLGTGYELTAFFLSMLGLTIWRVNENANFYRELLTAELEKDGL